MSLSLDFCTHAMRTILGFLNKPASQAAAFVESIQKTCYWMKADRFEKVCEKIVEELSPGRLPTYKQFKATYHELENTLNWKAHDAATRLECAACHAGGWVYVNLYNPNIGEAGYVDRFVKPCPTCRRDHPSANMPLPKGWVETEMPVTYQYKGKPFDPTQKKAFGGIDLLELAGRMEVPVTGAKEGNAPANGTQEAPDEGDFPPF